MTLVRRANSQFWYAQFQINKRTIVRSTKTSDRKAAEKIEAALRAQAYTEMLSPKKRTISISDCLDRYIRDRQDTPSYRNLVSHRKTLLRYLRGTDAITSLTSSMLEDFKHKRLAEKCSPQTIKHGLNLLLGAVRFAKRLEFDAPQLYAPTLKVSSGRLRYLSFDEERRLLEELAPNREARGLASWGDRSPKMIQAMQNTYDLAVLLLDTGARHNEIANLKWEQVDLIDRAMHLWRSKVANEGLLLLTDRAYSVLERRSATRTRSPYVFTDAEGGPRGYKPIAFRKALDRCGLIDCTIHTLRHTYASRLIQGGMSVYEVKVLLGHSDIRTTMRYAHLEQKGVTAKARELVNAMNRTKNTDEKVET